MNIQLNCLLKELHQDYLSGQLEEQTKQDISALHYQRSTTVKAEKNKLELSRSQQAQTLLSTSTNSAPAAPPPAPPPLFFSTSLLERQEEQQYIRKLKQEEIIQKQHASKQEMFLRKKKQLHQIEIKRRNVGKKINNMQEKIFIQQIKQKGMTTMKRKKAKQRLDEARTRFEQEVEEKRSNAKEKQHAVELRWQLHHASIAEKRNVNKIKAECVHVSRREKMLR